jgi:hypothetical protein
MGSAPRSAPRFTGCVYCVTWTIFATARAMVLLSQLGQMSYILQLGSETFPKLMQWHNCYHCRSTEHLPQLGNATFFRQCKNVYLPQLWQRSFCHNSGKCHIATGGQKEHYIFLWSMSQSLQAGSATFATNRALAFASSAPNNCLHTALHTVCILLGAHIYEPGASPCKVFFFLKT